jgi:PAS domain S-box-containing protein
MLNKLLQRQVQKHFGNPDNVPEEFSSLLKVISESYDHYEKDRNMLERSIELTSMEMIELNTKLGKEALEVNRILKNINEVVFSIDMATWEYTYISAACTKVYGYTEEEFRASRMLWKDVIHPVDQHLVDPDDERIHRGEDYSLHYRIIHKNNSIRWLDAKVQPTLDSAGKLKSIDIIVNDVTETKEAQQRLERAYDEFNKLFSNINEVLFSVDMVSYKVIQMSPACEKLFGYTPEEFLTQPDLWQKIIHPDDLHISHEQVGILTKGQQVFNQYRIIHKNGSIRWTENKVIPTLDENGRLIRLDGITNDITLKRENAQKLQESEMRFRTLIENGADMLTMVSAEGNILYESPAITATLGYTTQENSGRSVYDLIHPDDREKATVAFGKALELEGIPIEAAARIKTKNGNYVFAEGHITNLLNVAGVNAIVSNFRDVTQRIEAEHNLAASQHRYKMVYDNPFLGIAVGTMDGNMQSVNDAFCAMLGYSREELFNKHFSEFTVAEDLEKERPFIRKMEKGEIDNYKLEKRYITKSGKIITVELSISCAKNDSGQILFVIAMIQDISLRKKAEELLEKSEANLTAILENTEASVYSLDRDCRYITFNSLLHANLKTVFNLDVKPGDHAYDFLEQFDVAEANFWRETYLKALDGENIRFVKDYSRGQALSFINFSINPIWENGKVVGLSCFSYDITQQKIGEETLQRSQANLRNLLENTDTAYVLLDKDATILSFNKLAADLAMEEMEEVLEEGKNYIDLMLPARREDVRKTIGKVLKRQTRVSYETKYCKPGSPEKWLTVNMHPIFNESKNVLGLSVAATDITARKNAEQIIRLSNERYELVTKATNDVIWDWDMVNNKIFRSENYKQIFGYDGIGDNIYTPSADTNVHPEDSERILNSIAEKVQDSNVTLWEDEYRYYRSNGELAYVQDRGYIIYDENEKPVRMVGAMRDITAEKLFAIERDKITSDLIRQNKNLEQFAYIVSHNLRAPLANITGLSRIIQMEKLEAKDRKISMDGLVKSVKKLDDVIIDLTNILQVKREIDEKREPISFSQLLEDINSSVLNFIEEEHVTIHSDFSAVNDIVSVKSYMHSIFYNLILNSIKYKKPGRRPHIEVRSKETGNKIILSFKDNGSGIDLALYGDKIFGLYKRFHYDVEGRGMGLFMVKTQVESLEGTITVNSRINEGAEFIIEFPKKSVAYKSAVTEDGQKDPGFAPMQIK